MPLGNLEQFSHLGARFGGAALVTRERIDATAKNLARFRLGETEFFPDDLDLRRIGLAQRTDKTITSRNHTVIGNSTGAAVGR